MLIREGRMREGRAQELDVPEGDSEARFEGREIALLVGTANDGRADPGGDDR